MPTLQPPIRFFRTDEGLRLPVIDVTDPRFIIPTDPAAMAELRRKFLQDDRRQRVIPVWFQRAMMRLAARRSPLAAALLTPAADHYDGTSTYVLKLGADNLVPPYGAPMDRRLAGSGHATCVRLRMQQLSGIMADAVAVDRAFTSSAPLHLINIGGGPSFDSVNALMLLRRDRPELLDRQVVVHIMDQNAKGAALCKAAVAALIDTDGPLHGVAVTVDYREYDWNDASALAGLVERIASGKEVALASSEGALFEYASDEAVVANLRALRPGVRFVAGSVTSERVTVASAWYDLKNRGVAGFTTLAEDAGYRLVRAEDSEMSHQVLLVPAG